MLYYGRIDLSKGTDFAKSNNGKESIICHYWYFNHAFKFQDSKWNGCHDLAVLYLNRSDFTIKAVQYCLLLKSKAIHLFNFFLLDDCGSIQNAY